MPARCSHAESGATLETSPMPQLDDEVAAKRGSRIPA
jgi:hypothetical protein